MLLQSGINYNCVWILRRAGEPTALVLSVPPPLPEAEVAAGEVGRRQRAAHPTPALGELLGGPYLQMLRDFVLSL